MFQYPTHTHEFIDANVFKLSETKIKFKENMLRDKMRSVRDLNRIMLPKQIEPPNEGKTIIDNIRNFSKLEKENLKKQHHFKSKSYSSNHFIKHEWNHPGKFIKFEHEKSEAWSCCMASEKNYQVIKII